MKYIQTYNGIVLNVVDVSLEFVKVATKNGHAFVEHDEEAHAGVLPRCRLDETGAVDHAPRLASEAAERLAEAEQHATEEAAFEARVEAAVAKVSRR